MKKSFMTRVLATGLSLAMAFSLSAATNVSVASAAAKPAMKSSKMTVKVGQKKNYQATAATQKAYKITKVKMSAAGKTKAKVTVNSSKKSIKVEGLAATKGSNVVITFKNNKTKKTTNVTTKVVVKAVDEKLTMTAAATKVKKITVTFNKPVDTTKAVITVKKGVATIASTTTFAADAKSAELALGSRITKGTYTVTVTGLQDEPLSADVVAEDEKLTTFQLLGNNLVADADVSTTATISFKALNQYDEMVAANSLQVSSTFASNTTVDVDPTATKVGVIKCEDITPTQAIAGTVGTIVIVDSLGTNLNAQVTYQSKAFPKTAEVVGIYNEKTEKIIEGNLKKTDTVAQYALMLNIKDQYGNEMSAAAVSKSGLQFNPAQILTDLNMPSALDAGTGGNAKDITYEGANNILVSFQCGNTKIQKAGTLSLTIVGMGGGGSLAQPVITVDEVAVIKSISVAPATAIYEGQKNDLVVEAYDADGKAVTSYDVLKAANINIQPASASFGTVSLNKNSDGTGKFVWNMTGKRVVSVPAGDTKSRNSTISTLTISANATGNPDFLIKTQTVTVWQGCGLWEVTGTTKDTVTSAASGTALTVDLSTLTYADQYGNEKKFADFAAADKANIYYYVTGTALTSDNVKTDVDVVSKASLLTDSKKIQLMAGSSKGSSTLYLKVYSTGSAADFTGDNVKALTDKYDLKLSLNVVDGKAIDVSDVEIASVNDGKIVYAATSGSITMTGSSSAYAVGSGSAVYGTAVPVVVTATVNGKKVILDPSQYTITNATVAGIATVAGVARQTVKKTVNVVVESENGALEASKEFEISNEDAKVVEIKKADAGVDVAGVTTDAAMTASELGDTFKFLTQYGENVTAAKKSSALYTVIFTGDNTGSDFYTMTGDKTQDINVDFKVGGDYTATVKVVLGDASFEQDVKIAVANS